MTDADRQLMRAFITSQDAHTETMQQILAKHEQTLYGNGQRGLVSKVYLLMWVLGTSVTGGVAFLAGLAMVFWP